MHWYTIWWQKILSFNKKAKLVKARIYSYWNDIPVKLTKVRFGHELDIVMRNTIICPIELMFIFKLTGETLIVKSNKTRGRYFVWWNPNKKKHYYAVLEPLIHWRQKMYLSDRLCSPEKILTETILFTLTDSGHKQQKNWLW